MRVVIFGATGMVGQGVLRECLRDAQVTRVLAVGGRPVGMTHPKLEDLVRRDFFDGRTRMTHCAATMPASSRSASPPPG